MLKKIILLMLCTTVVFAQDSNYSSNNYTTWKIIKADTKDKYVIATPNFKTNATVMMPICTLGDSMIFTYEMMAEENMFYNKKSEAVSVNEITRLSNKSEIYVMKVDLDEDNDLDKGLRARYDRICALNKATRNITYKSKSKGIEIHGVVRYIGDTSIRLPF
jgi:hypothetical protein